MGSVVWQLQGKWKRAWRRQCGRCHYCGMAMILNANGTVDMKMATRDHVHPKSLGGELTANNGVLACYGCNTRKGSMSAAEFRALIAAEAAQSRKRG